MNATLTAPVSINHRVKGEAIDTVSYVTTFEELVEYAQQEMTSRPSATVKAFSNWLAYGVDRFAKEAANGQRQFSRSFPIGDETYTVNATAPIYAGI